VTLQPRQRDVSLPLGLLGVRYCMSEGQTLSILALLWQILFTPLLVADPLSAMRASLRRSGDEFEDGVAHGGQSWLKRRPVDSFFPALL
jgi:hypothetical protein